MSKEESEREMRYIVYVVLLLGGLLAPHVGVVQAAQVHQQGTLSRVAASLDMPLTQQSLIVLSDEEQQQASPAGGDPAGCQIDFGFNVKVDVCQIFGAVVGFLFKPLTDSVTALTQDTGAFTNRIPEIATYANPVVETYWQALLNITDSLVILCFLYLGLRQLLNSHNAISYAAALEVLPRLFLALLLAHSSLTLAKLIIDFANALCSAIGGTLLPAQLFGAGHTDAQLFVFDGIMQVIQTFLALILVIEAGVETAALAVAIPLGPLCLLCLFHPDTQHIGRTWISFLIAMSLMRFLQVLCVSMGAALLSAGILQTMPGAELFNLVGGTGILFVATLIPGFLRQWILIPLPSGAQGTVTALFFAARML